MMTFLAALAAAVLGWLAVKAPHDFYQWLWPGARLRRWSRLDTWAVQGFGWLCLSCSLVLLVLSTG